MGKKLLVIMVSCLMVLVLAAALPLVGCGGEVTKDKIVIGAARPISGPLNAIGDLRDGADYADVG